jgi:tetratricopeptide (TPR) repeat protein
LIYNAHLGSRREMELQSALGMSLIYFKGISDQAHSALSRALQIAEARGDRASQFRLLGRLHMFHRRAGHFVRAFDVARESEAVAKELGDPAAAAITHSMLGASLHLLGQQADARTHLEAALTQLTTRRHAASAELGFGHYRDRARVALARTLWLHGYPDRALRLARDVVEQTKRHPVTVSIALTWASSVFHWAGDLASAETSIERAIAHASTYLLTPFQIVAYGLKGESLIKRGEVHAGTELLRSSLETLHADRYELYTSALGGALAVGLAMSGRHDQALTTINGIIAEAERNSDLYNLPELVRLRGTFLERTFNAAEAERCFLQSIDLADRQDAPSWRLRTSIDLARLRLKQNRRTEAYDLLAAAYARFNEGFDTADLKAAKRLLDHMVKPSAKQIQAAP